MPDVIIPLFGPYRLYVKRYRGARRFGYWRGGQATAWPWRQWFVPGIGSIVLARSRPRKNSAGTPGGES